MYSGTVATGVKDEILLGETKVGVVIPVLLFVLPAEVEATVENEQVVEVVTLLVGEAVTAPTEVENVAEVVNAARSLVETLEVM